MPEHDDLLLGRRDDSPPVPFGELGGLERRAMLRCREHCRD